MDLTLKEVQEYGTKMLRDVVTVCEKRGIQYFAIYGTLLGTIRHSGPIPWDYDIDIYVPENQIGCFVEAIENDLGEKYWVDYRNNTKIQRPFPRVGLRGFETDILHLDVFRMSGLPNRRINQRIITWIGRKLFVIWKSKTIDSIFYYPDMKRRVLTKIVSLISWPVSANRALHMIDSLCKKYEVMTTDYVGRIMGRGAIYPTRYFRKSILLPYDDFMIRVPEGYEQLLSQMYGDYMKFPPKEEQDRFLNMTYHVRAL